MKTILALFSRYKFILVILILSLFAGKSLLLPGLPPTHDGEYHVIRFYEFDKTLRSGDFYPRWAADLNNGFGIPLFNFVYPFPNYFASAMHALGSSFIDAFKLNMFFAIIIGALLFYLWARLFWGDLGGFVASTFYTFTPYHFVDIYVRGSVGEVWALAFFPGFLWAVTVLFQTKNKRYLLYAGIFLALIIFSHNILAEMFFIFGGIYCLFLIALNKNKKQFVTQTVGIYLIGIGLTAIFWLPALFEIRYVRGLQIFDVTRNFPEIYQLLIPSWGTGFSGGSIDSQMSFQVGLANLFAVFCSAGAILWLRKKRHAGVLAIVLFFLGSFFLVFYLMLPMSLSVWQQVPFFSYFQFPWRFLSLMMLITSFLAGIFGYLGSRRLKIWGSMFACFICIGLSYSYTIPAYYHQRNDAYYTTRENFIRGTNSPGNSFNTVWFKSAPGYANQPYLINEPTYKKYILDADSLKPVQTGIAYFPGWSVFLNGKGISPYPDTAGLLAFDPPQRNGIVEVQFNDTIVRALATAVSLLMVVLVTVLLVVWA